MTNAVIYLRKSRADLELEKNNVNDTLKRHEKILIEYAKNNNIEIIKTYKEVVSGESIAVRPKMQELLKDIESGAYDAVLVMEIERLARGNTIDQGIVAQTFQYTNTKIITPTKVYDPNNEFDQEYFEFGLYMSRREYKTISRRLSAGRLQSVKEGKYVCSITPFGYDKEKLKGQKGYKLIINKEEAEVVKLIFQSLIDGMGTTMIAKKLNVLGIKGKVNSNWTPAMVRNILVNPVHAGIIVWNRRPVVKTFKNGELVKTTKIQKEYIKTKGLHEPIINIDDFNLIQKILRENSNKRVPKQYDLRNPLAGLIKCGICGKNMIRRPYPNYQDGLMCPYINCNNISSHLALVEERILQVLENILKDYKIILKDYKIKPKSHTDLKIFDNEIIKLKKQLEKAYNLVEQGLYTNEEFIERKFELNKKIKNLESEKEKNNLEISKNKINLIEDKIPKLESFLMNYKDLSISDKNSFLKSIIKEIIYIKTEGGRGKEDYFKLKITRNI